MPKRPVPPALSAYLAELGRKGGSAKGDSKVRGDRAYYQEIARKGLAKRYAKRKKKS